MDELTRVSEIAIHTLKFFRQLSKPTTVYLTELVESALVLYQARLVSSRVAVQKDFRACPPITAMAGELRQVIVNLVGNAVDAMRGGGTLNIRIDRAREYSNGSRPGMRLTIADSGSGIPPEIKNRLFEPFVSSKGETGTGLGLWVSSEIVRKHGGTIKFKSSSHLQRQGRSSPSSCPPNLALQKSMMQKNSPRWNSEPDPCARAASVDWLIGILPDVPLASQSACKSADGWRTGCRN